MSDITENNKNGAKIMAGLLRSGYTMLNLACPLCNNPLFRNKDNDIFCPICNKKVIIQKESTTESNEKDISKSELEKQNSIKINEHIDYNPNIIKAILKEKINLITTKLEQETQIDLIERYIKVLTKLFDLLNKLFNENSSPRI